MNSATQAVDSTDGDSRAVHGTCPPAGSVGFRLTTLPHIDGKITQELQESIGEQTRTLTRWVMDSREKGVHDALVQLGWTPPNAGLHRTSEAQHKPERTETMTDQPTNQNAASEGTGESPCSDGQVCCSCGGTTDLEYGPDPYAEEIGGDDTPVWECASCRHESAMDI